MTPERLRDMRTLLDAAPVRYSGTAADACDAAADDIAELRAANAAMLAALRVTAGNIRSLGPAGAIPEPYTAWLEVVERAIARTTGKE